MQSLARLDYDKFEAPEAVSVSQAARQQAVKEAQGTRILSAMGAGMR
jgi:hypothetical protein